MTYIPHTEAERRAMLEEVGVKEIADFFQDVPADVRFPTLDLPAALAELDAAGELREIASYNLAVNDAPLFLGAGAYNHFVPSVVDAIIRRGEFLTAYTPYQPEVSQGTLQAIFEYQSMMCALTGMEVSNASHYDGATALAEAVIMALNIGRGRRKRVILSPAIHPQYRATVRTYTQGMGLEIVEEPLTADLADLRGQLNGNTALLAVQTPNFFGELEDLTGLADAVHSAGALLCVVINPISLGILKPPGDFGADIVVGEGQPLGIPLSYGGPYLGIFTTRDKHARKMAGRLVGETVDSNGQRGYVLTLSTREQHIRRAKATSNICTNQGLLALAATVYLSALGKCGLRQVAELCYHKAHYAADRIDALDGYSVVRDKPFFHEFAVRCPRPVAEINEELLDEWGVIGGYDLGEDYPHLENHMLIAVTEMISRDEIDLLVEGLGEEGKPWLSL
jgi:glycine dehydrogenase subunit 1